jgi:hypothetical protein
MKNKSFNEVGAFSLHVKVQMCFESEASLGFAVGAHCKVGFLSHFYPSYPCGKKIVVQFGVTVCRKSLKNEPLGEIDMKILKVAVALGLATSLSGCLSEDDNTDVDVVSMASTLFDQAAFASPVQFYDIDQSSTATMTGVIGARFADMDPIYPPMGTPVQGRAMEEPPQMGFAGQLSMEADFENRTVSGSTSNLGLYEYSSGCLYGEECQTTRLSSLDGDLTLTGTIKEVRPVIWASSDAVRPQGIAVFYASLSGEVEGDITLEGNDYAYTANVSLETGEVGGEFLQNMDGRSFARSGLNGSVNAVYEDENGMTGEYGGGLEGYMLVEGDIAAAGTD